MSTIKLPTQWKIQSNIPMTRPMSSIFKLPVSLGSLKKVSSSFGLKSCSSNFKTTSMAMYEIKLIGPEGEEQEIGAPDDGYILNSSENAGVELPFSCRAGTCSTCVGMIESGTIDQSEGSVLDGNQMEQGLLLTCISYPRSDLIIHTHKEGDLH